MATESIEIFAIFEDESHATLSEFPPSAGSESVVKVEHYLVNGSHQLFRRRGPLQVDDFEAWRRQKEAEGFVFEPLAA